jgi:THUMP domain-containing protein
MVRMNAAGAVYCRSTAVLTATTCPCDVTGSLDDYRWLTGPAARRWLAHAASELAARTPLVTLATRLRRELSAERTHLVLAQVELRRRAEEKFTLAGEMFFTLAGLAQATDEPLARYKAARFPPGMPAADLCCGIGGDLVSLADGRNCLAVDRDPIAAHLAQVNAEVCGRTNVAVECRDAGAATLARYQAWHIDPDRRPAGKRTVQVERFEPPWEMIETLLAACENAAVKLAPATKLPDDVARRCQREWIETRSECRQQVAWFGSLAREPGTSAATVIDGPQGPATIVGACGQPGPVASSVGRYVYDPSAAVRAAQLTSELCRQMSVKLLDTGNSYLTSEQLVHHPLASGFEVLGSLPFDLRRLKEAVRQLGLGPVEVKKRGVDIDPDHIRRQLTQEQGDAGVVLIAKVGIKAMAIIARRTAPPE